jgi:hypothetical protein
MDCQVKSLTESNEYLARKRDELLEEKTEADHKREDLKTQVKA